MKYPEQYIFDKHNWMIGDSPIVMRPTGKFPFVAYHEWETLEDLMEFVHDINSTAIPGMVVTVVNDGNNNGVYHIVSIGADGEVSKLSDIFVTDNLSNRIDKFEEEVSNEFGNVRDEISDVNDVINDRIDKTEERIDKEFEDIREELVSSNEYVSEVPEHWLTEKIGGVEQGLNKEDELLTGKTVNQMLDVLLYPTVQPEIVEPSISFEYNDDKVVYVGHIVQHFDDEKIYATSFSRGSVSYENADGNYFYTGDAEGKISIDNNIEDDNGELRFVSEGIYAIKYSVNFANGPKLLDNKKNDATVESYKSGKLEKEEFVHVVYPIFVNNGIHIKDLQTNKVDYLVEECLFEVEIPNENETKKFEIHVPSTVLMDEVKQYNTISDTYNIPVELEQIEDITHPGYSVYYNVFVRTTDNTDIQGVSKYQIKLKLKIE